MRNYSFFGIVSVMVWLIVYLSLPLAAAEIGLAGFIDDFDINGDHLLSLEEFPGPAEHFARLDSNQDGFIEPSETPQRAPPGSSLQFDSVKLLASSDHDENGLLTENEFPGPSSHFTRLDIDQNGYLTPEELLALPSCCPPPGRSFADDDQDHDNLVSVDEFSGPAELFELLDSNDDCYMSLEDTEAQFGPPPAGQIREDAAI